MDEQARHMKEDLLKLFKNYPESLEKLNRASRFPLDKESTVIFKEESIQDFNKESKKRSSGKGAASFLLR